MTYYKFLKWAIVVGQPKNINCNKRFTGMKVVGESYTYATRREARQAAKELSSKNYAWNYLAIKMIDVPKSKIHEIEGGSRY